MPAGDAMHHQHVGGRVAVINCVSPSAFQQRGGDTTLHERDPNALRESGMAVAEPPASGDRWIAMAEVDSAEHVDHLVGSGVDEAERRERNCLAQRVYQQQREVAEARPSRRRILFLVQARRGRGLCNTRSRHVRRRWIDLRGVLRRSIVPRGRSAAGRGQPGRQGCGPNRATTRHLAFNAAHPEARRNCDVLGKL